MRKIVILIISLLASIYWQGLDNAKASFSGDFIYSNQSDGGKIYKKNVSDVGDGVSINSVNSGYMVFTIDGQYIIYTNKTDGNKCYKKNANDSLDGIAITINQCFWPDISPNGVDLVYYNASDGGKIYQKSINDSLNGIAITSIQSVAPKYSSDGLYIYFFNHRSDLGRIWRKNANDSLNGSQFNGTFLYGYYLDFSSDLSKLIVNQNGSAIVGGTLRGYYNDYRYIKLGGTGYNTFQISDDGNSLIYNNPSDGGKIYIKDITILNESSGPGIVLTSIAGLDPVYITITGPINGTCGTNATTFSTGATRYTGTFCSRGTRSPTTPGFPIGGEVVSWSCLGSNSGSDASCSAYKQENILTPINASCGTNIGTYHSYNTRYTGTFCSRGTRSPTSPSFPGLGKTTTWICEGIYGGNNISCSASKNDVVTPLNGSCGTSAKVYTTSDTRYTGTFCSRGTRSPTSPSFPTSGNSVSWSCNGTDGGVNMFCIASKETDENILGQCGTRGRMYGTGETRFDGTFCSRGTRNPSSLSFPDIGQTTYWTCDGSFGYLGSVSCRATRQGDGTTTSWFGIDWSFISKPLDKISQALYNFIHFEAKWLGFNFDFDSLKNLFSLNLKGNSYTVNNTSCSNMLNNRITYQHITWNYNGGVGNNGKGVFTSNTETCNVIRGSITYRTISGGGNILSSDFRVSNGNICSITTTVYNDGTYWTNDTTQIENGFSYLTKTNTNDIINFNDSILKNIRIIPFSLVLFGFDLRQFLNDSITGLVEIIVNIIIYPINVLNVVYQDFSILFIQNFPNQYCYYGMTISKITFTPSNLISSDIPYTSNLGIGIFVMIIFTISALTYLFKKFF